MNKIKLITFFLFVFFFCFSAMADTFVTTTIETEIEEDALCPDTTYLEYDEETNLCVCVDDYETSYEDDGTIICTATDFDSETLETAVEEVVIETEPVINAYVSGGALMMCSFNPHASSGSSFPIFVFLFAMSIPLFLLRFSRG